MRQYFVTILFVASIVLVLFNCNSSKDDDAHSPYLNIRNKDAHYVGMQTCKTCHWQVYETFIKTGMGQSWGPATKSKSAANYTHALVYDTINDFYYKPYWDGDSLTIMEYRLQGNDTVHKRTEKVSYIVGSGQHTNSHIININGYLHQAPITFYTQKGKWDLAPGFEKGLNTRFDRKIEMECISCHNGYPQFINGSLNKFGNVPLGIDCERCHGPGSIHVSEKQKGNIVDTAKKGDYSIVNPRRLTTEQQNNLCQRCHLQGITVLNDNKTFFDFKPSQALSSTMNTFMPIYKGDDKAMIMASHVERMKMSNCYINSGKMSCISCHNPHVSVKYTPQEQYITACNTCHDKKNKCSESEVVRTKKKNDCIVCHMPKNGSIDIPHVAVTDHYIRKRISNLSNKNEIASFIELKCYNQNNPEAKIRARAFLEFYERYEPKSIFIDSAIMYLKKAGVNVENEFDNDLLRAFFLKENFQKIIELSKGKKLSEISDAWTCYRIGEAFFKENKKQESIAYFNCACQLKPLALDFQSKLANAYVTLNQLKEGKKVLEFILSENPKHSMANFNLGYIYMQQNNLPQAKKYLQEAIMLNPDHVQSLINLAVVYYQSNEKKLIKPLLLHALKLSPDNTQIKAMLADL